MTERAADPARGRRGPGGSPPRVPQARPPHARPPRAGPPQPRPHHQPGPPPSELPTRRVTATGAAREHGEPRGEGRAARRWRSRSVALARVLAGGLVMLALTVLGAPLALGGPGPGTGTVVAHVVAALVAVAATAVAAHRRTPTAVALVAGLAVPVTLLVLLWFSWWA